MHDKVERKISLVGCVPHHEVAIPNDLLTLVHVNKEYAVDTSREELYQEI